MHAEFFRCVLLTLYSINVSFNFNNDEKKTKFIYKILYNVPF